MAEKDSNDPLADLTAEEKLVGLAQTIKKAAKQAGRSVSDTPILDKKLKDLQKSAGSPVDSSDPTGEE